jgi:hypothetical protein
MRWFGQQKKDGDRFEIWLGQQIELLWRQSRADGMPGVIAEFAYKLLQQVLVAYRAFQPGGGGNGACPEDLPTFPGRKRRDDPKSPPKKNGDR